MVVSGNELIVFQHKLLSSAVTGKTSVSFALDDVMGILRRDKDFFRKEQARVKVSGRMCGRRRSQTKLKC